MKKIFSMLVSVTTITFCLHSCKSSVERPKQTLEKESGNGVVPHFYGKNKDDQVNYLTTPIGTTNDNIVFKEDGKVYVQLGNSNQIFDVTKLHQQKRLFDIKKIMQ